MTSIRFDRTLIEKYDAQLPRYTSYPTALQFHEGFDQPQYLDCVAISNQELIPRPLSLYLHLPFCHSLCYYCGCMKKITRHARHGRDYLACLETEIDRQARLFDADREVLQLHLGGGTPTFFDDTQLEQLVLNLRRNFSLLEDGGEYAIEIDPRTVDNRRIEHLLGLGFNRFSLGLQDLDSNVQAAVNRVQDTDHALSLLETARQGGADSVSVDLIYGLPLQTEASFARTLERVIQARPDRLAIYNYAHLPRVFRAQRLIQEADLPDAATRLAILESNIATLTAAGYEYLGMDHFALPEDELTRAMNDGTLHRNFQGYSTLRECDTVGLGVSAIGQVGDCYAQNHKTIPAWKAALEDGALPIWRGLKMTQEDTIRREIIQQIMCRNRVDYSSIEQRFGIEFEDYFALELLQYLRPLADDGLVDTSESGFTVTPAGRLLVRHIAACFDAHLPRGRTDSPFSRAI